jgi:mannitol/fructose-specific phosphotransferase system IIA component (Ntr-type)
MRLTDFLSAERIKAPLEGTNKDEVLKELIQLLPLPDQHHQQQVLKAVQEREQLMSTGIGNGIAIPHGIATVNIKLMAALGIPAQPIDFQAVDGQPVKLIFLVVADENHRGANIRALARISRLLHREDFRLALTKCTSPEEAMKVIREEEARHKI